MKWQDAIIASNQDFAYRDRTDGGIDLRHARGLQWSCRRDGEDLQRVGRPRPGASTEWNPVVGDVFNHILLLPMVQEAINEEAPPALALPLWQRVERAKERHAEILESAELFKLTGIEDPTVVQLLESMISQSRELLVLLR